MTYLILIIVSIALFAGFLLLTRFEKKRGLRVAGMLRNKLDARTSRAVFIVSHVDWSAFVKHIVVTSAERIAHDIAHATLLIVRTLERLLTRAVKYLREKRGAPAITETDEPLRPLARAASHLRSALRRARVTGAKKPQSTDSE